MEVVTNIPEELMQLPETFDPPPEDVVIDDHKPNVDSLNRQQKIAFNLSVEYAGIPKGQEVPYRAIVVNGFAGTGKTYTTAEIIKYIVMMHHKRIAITAPTNKAVKVLKKTTRYKHNLITYKTIHALLGLKEQIDDFTGKQSFVPDYNEERAIDAIDVLILDETSMLPKEIWGYINEEINRRGLRVLFLGDPLQLPPVNEEASIPFMAGQQIEHDLYPISLTEIVRQKEGNPILELATLVRENIHKNILPFNYQTHTTEQGGIVMISSLDKSKLYDLCEVYFRNPRFVADPDFMKVLAWTNEVVNHMNWQIRLRVYKEHITYSEDQYGQTQPRLPKLIVGEKLIADKPILKEEYDPVAGKMKKFAVFTTNDEFEVVQFDLGAVNAFGNYNVRVYHAKVRSHDIDGKVTYETIDIIHESDEELYKQIIAILKKRALDEPDRYEKKKLWRIYYDVQNKFADVKYNYALTVHKSQGSTYENCIVLEKNIDRNPRVMERNSMKYVAYTRARKHLFIVK